MSLVLIINSEGRKYHAGTMKLDWRTDAPDQSQFIQDLSDKSLVPVVGKVVEIYLRDGSTKVFAGTIDEVGHVGLYQSSRELAVPVRVIGFNNRFYTRILWDRFTGEYPVYRSYDSTVDVSGTGVTRTSGSRFDPDLVGKTVKVGGVDYGVTAVTSPDTLTLDSDAGSQTGAALAYTVYCGDIVKDLISNTGSDGKHFMDGEGFSYNEGDIQDGEAITEVVFGPDPMTVADGIKLLVEKNTNFAFTTDCEQKCYFGERTMVEAPFQLTDVSGKYRRDLGKTVTREDVRNVEVSTVDWKTLDVTKQTITGDGVTKSWFLDSLIGEMVYMKLNSVTASFSQADDGSAQFYFKPASRQLWQDSLMPVLEEGDQLEVGYYPLGHNLIEYADDDAIAERQAAEGTGSGRYELVVDRTQAPGQVEAYQDAQASVERYKDNLEKIHAVTWHDGLRPGQILTSGDDKYGVDGTFFLESVSATDKGVEASEHDLLYTVEGISSARRLTGVSVLRDVLGRSGSATYLGRSQGSPTAKPVHVRTLVLKDLTIGDNIADSVTVDPKRTGPFKRVTGVLRKAIASNLVVRINMGVDKSEGGGSVVTLLTATIPSSTVVGDVIVFTTFAANPDPTANEEYLTFDVVDSDGSKDAGGIATFTLGWE